MTIVIACQGPCGVMTPLVIVPVTVDTYSFAAIFVIIARPRGWQLFLVGAPVGLIQSDRERENLEEKKCVVKKC